MPADSGAYNVFQGTIEENVKLKSKVITSEIETNKHHEVDIKENNLGIEEHRPIYPNWTPVDIAVGNLRKDHPEETSIRKAQELALSLQFLGESTFQDKIVDRIQLVRIPVKETVKAALVYGGTLPVGEILLERKGERGEKIMEKYLVEEGQPYFRYFENRAGLDLYQEKHVKKIVRTFLDFSRICERLNSYCMARLGLTKSREMTGVKTMNETHEKRTIQAQNFPSETDEEKNSLFGKGPGGN